MNDDFRVEFTARSLIDLQAAKDWLTQRGAGQRSHGRYVSILKALVDLETSPYRWPTSGHVGFRKRSIEGYRIFYSVDGSRRMITVRRIFGPGQDASTS